jgi:Domain of unknown function (DUF4232)
MRDEDLRDQLASWIEPVRGLPAPDIKVIRRRARRHRARSAGLAAAAIVLVIGAAAIIRSAVQAPAAPLAPSAPSAPTAPTAPARQHQAIARCSGRDLRISGPQAPAVTMPGTVAAIVFRNTGSTSCMLEGWPKVAIAGPRPAPGTIPVKYATVTAAWSVRVSRVVLRPGASAAATLLIAAPVAATGCGSPAWSITPPGAARSVVIRGLSDSPPVCAGDTIVVSAVYRGHAPVIGSR